MYVILDMHQDVLSSKYNTYDGAPLWLVDMMPQPKHKYPWPFKSADTFSKITLLHLSVPIVVETSHTNMLLTVVQLM